MTFTRFQSEKNPENPGDKKPLNALFKTDRLVFRNFQASDIRSAHRYASDPIVTRMTYWGPYDYIESEGFLQKTILRSQENPRMFFDLAIILNDQESSRLIGGCKLHITDGGNREGEIGYYLEQQSWGKGFATETANALLAFAFDRLDLHRIAAMCFVENRDSAHVLEKIGMQREGTLRQHRLKNGKWIDSYLFSVLDQDWQGFVRTPSRSPDRNMG